MAARLSLDPHAECKGFVSETELSEACDRATAFVLRRWGDGFGLALEIFIIHIYNEQARIFIHHTYLQL